MFRAPASRSASAGSHTSTDESPPRKSAPAPASPPSAPLGLGPWEFPVVAASRPPSECTDASPPRVDTCPLAIARRGRQETPRRPVARPRPTSSHRRPPRRGSSSLVSMRPAGRHACRCGPAPPGNVGPVAAWPCSRVGAAIGALCRGTRVLRGGWNRSCRSCPRACLLVRHCPRRDPSLRPRCSSRASSLLRSPRIPAAPRSFSPVAYTSRAAPTRAAQTGLSCFVPLRVRVLRPLPHRAPLRVRLRTGAHWTSSSPRHDRLDARVVNLMRLQASRDVAARGLAPSVEALDTPLEPRNSHHALGVCYSALRRLPRRDLHPLEKNDTMTALARAHHHDAPWRDSTSPRGAADLDAASDFFHDLLAVEAAVLDEDCAGVHARDGAPGHEQPGNVGLERVRIVDRRLPFGEADPGAAHEVGVGAVA